MSKINEIEEFCDNLDAGKKPKSNKTIKLVAIGIIFLLVGIASAGILSSFMSVSTTITVENTALQSDGNNLPLTITETFANANAGDYFTTQVNFTNTRDDCYFLVNYTLTNDEGVSGVLLNETGSEIEHSFYVNASETRNLSIKWEISLLAEAGQYTGNINFTPEEAERV